MQERSQAEVDRRQVLVEEIASQMAERYGLKVPKITVLSVEAGSDGECIKKGDLYELYLGNRFNSSGHDSYQHEVTHALHMENNRFLGDMEDPKMQLISAMIDAEYGKKITIPLHRFFTSRMSLEIPAYYFGYENVDSHPVVEPTRYCTAVMFATWGHSFGMLGTYKLNPFTSLKEELKVIEDINSISETSYYLGGHIGHILSRHRKQVNNEKALLLARPDQLLVGIMDAFAESSNDESFEHLLVEKFNAIVVPE